MYLEYYGLEQQPFSTTPNPDFFFSGGDRGVLLETLINAVIDREGMVKVVGNAGCGKTTLCRVLAQRLPDSIVTAFLINPNLTPDQLYSVILTDFKQAHLRDAQTYQYRRQLEHYLRKVKVSGRQALLLVDEAQSMPLETIEELCFISDLEDDNHKLLQIIFFGQNELNTMLGSSDVGQVRERITRNMKIPDFTLQDTEEYIVTRLLKAGCQTIRLFKPTALAAIHKAANGSLRRTNMLANNALKAAFRADAEFVEPGHIKNALSVNEYSEHVNNWKKSALIAAGVAGIGFYMGTFANIRSSMLVTPIVPEVKEVSTPITPGNASYKTIATVELVSGKNNGNLQTKPESVRLENNVNVVIELPGMAGAGSVEDNQIQAAAIPISEISKISDDIQTVIDEALIDSYVNEMFVPEAKNRQPGTDKRIVM